MTKKMMETKFILLFLAVGLVWTGTALAINVPDGDFDTPVLADGTWAYVNDIVGGAWFATGSGPWVGNNYSYDGYDYPGMGHTGAQWVDLNTYYIAQALGGETYEEGMTYELSIYATTGTGGQGLYLYFTDATSSSNGWEGAPTLFDSGLIEVPVSGWTRYSAQYTASAADAGKTIGIGIYGRGSTYGDTVGLLGSWVMPVSPPNEDTNVFLDTTLQWTAPTGFDVTGYDVYFGTEPNKLDNPLVVDNELTTTFDPFGEGDMAYETPYYWWVDVYEPNGVEPYTPIRHVSDRLTFTTIPPIPVITADPVGTVVDAGGPATLFAVEHINGTSYEWWFQGGVVDSGATASGETITLSLLSIGVLDEGLYYCKVINDDAPGGVDSATARLMTKRLVGHWPMDGTGTDRNVADSSLGGADGTVVSRNVTDLGTDLLGSGAGWSWVPGIDGDALDLPQDPLLSGPDVHDYVILATSGDPMDLEFGSTTDFSVSVWVKGTDFTVPETTWDAAIISNKDWNSGANAGWVMDVKSGNGQFEWNIGSGARADYDASGGQRLDDGEWHHMVVTHDRDGNATCYTDGVLQAQVNMDYIGNIDSGYPTVIGTDGAEGTVWGAWFKGTIDDVRMWNYVINPYAVATLYTDFVPTADKWCVENASIPDYNNSCTVDLGDMATIALKWLDCNLVPDCLDQHDYSVD